jgi:hypothetical protein
LYGDPEIRTAECIDKATKNPKSLADNLPCFPSGCQLSPLSAGGCFSDPLASCPRTDLPTGPPLIADR